MREIRMRIVLAATAAFWAGLFATGARAENGVFADRIVLGQAAALTGLRVESTDDMRRAGEALLALGAGAVVVKGGHLASRADDLFLDGERAEWLRAPRVITRCTHGTGCTFSAAIAANLALGLPLFEAIVAAKTYLTDALLAGYEVGDGHSPVDHFHAGTRFPANERITA